MHFKTLLDTLVRINKFAAHFDSKGNVIAKSQNLTNIIPIFKFKRRAVHPLFRDTIQLNHNRMLQMCTQKKAVTYIHTYIHTIQGCIKKFRDWSYRLERIHLIKVRAVSPSEQSPCAVTHRS